MKSLLRDFPSSIRPYSIDMLMIVFLLAYSLIGMWNFGINMATFHEDDNPIFYAYAFKDPSLFEGDFPIGFPLSLLLPFKVVTSAMVWIPSVSWKYFDLDPFMTTGWLTLLQGFLLGLSIYIFSLAVTGKKEVAFIATFFAYGAAPWTWAPAGYGNISTWNFLPYPATLATSPILIAFTLVLRKRVLPALFLLVLAGLIHPGITLHAAVIMGVFFILQEMKEPSGTRTLLHLAGIAAVVVVTLLPSLWIQMTLNFEPLGTAETMAGMRHNQHLWPWGFEYRWYPSLGAMLAWALLAFLSFRWRNDWRSGALTLCLSAFVGACLMGASQIFGGILKNPALLNFIGLRSCQWFILISLPLIVNYWYAYLRSGTMIGITSVLICLTVPFSVHEYSVVWFSPLILIFFFLDLKEGHLSMWRLSSEKKHQQAFFAVLVVSGLLLGALAIFVIYSVYTENSAQLQQVTASFMRPLRTIKPRNFILFISAAILAGLLLRRLNQASRPIQDLDTQRRIPKRLSGVAPPFSTTALSLLIIAYGLLFLSVQWKGASLQNTTAGSSLIDAQIWARQHTGASAVFVVPSGGWRTMSQRRKFDPFTRESYAYIAPRQSKEHRDRLLRFYGISEQEGLQLRGYGPKSVYAMQRERFFNYAESDFLRFAFEFGATHLVLPVQGAMTKRTALSLPIVFQNSKYIIYELPASQDLGKLDSQKLIGSGQNRGLLLDVEGNIHVAS